MRREKSTPGIDDLKDLKSLLKQHDHFGFKQSSFFLNSDADKKGYVIKFQFHKWFNPKPIGSVYGIYLPTFGQKSMVNVDKYTIHGSYGNPNPYLPPSRETWVHPASSGCVAKCGLLPVWRTADGSTIGAQGVFAWLRDASSNRGWFYRWTCQDI